MQVRLVPTGPWLVCLVFGLVGSKLVRLEMTMQHSGLETRTKMMYVTSTIYDVERLDFDAIESAIEDFAGRSFGVNSPNSEGRSLMTSSRNQMRCRGQGTLP